MVWISLCFILGIVIQSNLSLSIALLGSLAGIVLILARYQKCLGVRASVILLIISGCLRVALHELVPSSHLSKFNVDPDSVYAVRAVVDDVGETKRGTPKILLRPVSIHQQIISDGSMILYAREMINTLQGGDTLIATMQIHRPRPKRNPHEFDYRDYLKRQNIFFEAFLEAPEELIILPGRIKSISLIMSDIKVQISNHFHKYLTPRSAGILAALILGEKSDVEESIRNDFANTGVIHVLAVSGLHVGYVSIILVTIFGLLRLPHGAKMLSVIGGLLFYVGLTGGAPSVMRASIMASLMIMGGLLERKSDIFNILASAAFIILAINPQQLGNLGFQLSFLAVLSIVTLFPTFKEWVSGISILTTHRLGKMMMPILDLFLVSLAAQVGTLAITMFYFNKIPIVSLFANLVVVPLIGVIVATGMSFLILGSLLPVLAPFWAATIEGAIDFMLWFIQQCASIDWAYITTRSLKHYELILLLMGVFSISLMKFRAVVKLWVIFGLLCLGIQTWQALLTPQNLELVVLDVGQGDAILIHAPNGKTMLVDAGLRFRGQDMGKDVILPYLKYRNWSRLDLFVITHPHNDHIGGAQYLVENIPISKVYMPDIEYESYGYKMLRESLDSEHIPTLPVFAGYIDSSLKPVYLRMTAPKWYDRLSQPSNVNNTSLVMQLFYGESSVMLTGDGEEKTEYHQLPFGRLLKSELIKAPHHGSKTSSSQDYINLVQPEVCLISLGEKNKFKHPSEITLKKYRKLGTEIHRTDLEGALIYTSDGKQWTRNDWR